MNDDYVLTVQFHCKDYKTMQKIYFGIRGLPIKITPEPKDKNYKTQGRSRRFAYLLKTIQEKQPITAEQLFPQYKEQFDKELKILEKDCAHLIVMGELEPKIIHNGQKRMVVLRIGRTETNK